MDIIDRPTAEQRRKRKLIQKALNAAWYCSVCELPQELSDHRNHFYRYPTALKLCRNCWSSWCRYAHKATSHDVVVWMELRRKGLGLA